MKIQQIYNHNVVTALDANGRVCVVTGKGIAYQKRPGDSINPMSIYQVFALREKGLAEKLSRIVENIPMEQAKVCDEIIHAAQTQLPGTLSEKIYLTLIDHVSFALERHGEGIDLTSSLKWEMQKFYPDEFRMGELALDIIEKRLHVRLHEDEAAFIAFHFVNARTGGNHTVQESLEMIHGILSIVSAFFGIDFDKESISYQRFLTHLNYFSRRVFQIGSEKDLCPPQANLWKQLSAEFPKEATCADNIAEYVFQQYSHTTSQDEKSYLIIHLHSLLTR